MNHPALDAAVISADLRVARIRHVYSDDELVDLQQWLSEPAIRIGAAPGDEFTPKQIISEVANTLGTSHYDEDVSHFIDILSGMNNNQMSMLIAFLGKTSETVIELGGRTLRDLGRAGLAAP
jgi:hypothetical protein